MRVFVTGASGFIGSAVVAELLSAGHRVLGLARSDTAAAAIAAAGADVHRGSLDDLDSLRAGARAADGVAHLAFNHDFTVPFHVLAENDARVVEAMGDALAGSHRPIVIASGVLGMMPGHVVTEADPTPRSWHRARSEEVVVALGSRGVRSSMVRLPPIVHGSGGDHGFVPFLISLARQHGVAAYIGTGENRWAAVHRLDAAKAFRLAIERAPAGAALQAIDDEGVPTREIAAAIGRGLGVPLVARTPEAAAAHFAWLAAFFATDSPASSARTRELLGWQPSRPDLLADLAEGHYFGAVSAKTA